MNINLIFVETIKIIVSLIVCWIFIPFMNIKKSTPFLSFSGGKQNSDTSGIKLLFLPLIFWYEMISFHSYFIFPNSALAS